MKESVLITIIVPIYNVSSYLDKCISSIIDQTYKDLEIILVDDGSTDNCGEICDRYAQLDRRINVIHKENGGLVSARKAGLDLAKGDYIAFVDGDDWIDKDMYQVLLDKALSSGVDFVDSSYLCVKANVIVEYKILEAEYEFDAEQIKAVIESWIVDRDKALIRSTIWTKLYKADVIRKSYAEVPDEMSLGEDVINYIALFKYANRATIISDSFYNYNYRSDSLSHSRSIRNWRKENEKIGLCTSMIEKYYPYINKNMLDTWYFRRGLVWFNNIQIDDEWRIPVYKCVDIDNLQNRRVVIYGAGNVGKDIYAQLSKYVSCNIVGWVDKNYQKYHYPYCTVQSSDSLNDLGYDIVIIAVLREKLADSIKYELIEKGVPEEKIIWNQVIKLTDDIEFKNVGYNIVKFTGGLGNQMFQYAFYRAMQERGINVKVNNMGYEIDKRNFELPMVFPMIQLQIDEENKFDSYKNSLCYHELYHEKEDGVFDASVFNCTDVSFLGYWQTERYFCDIKEKIRAEFTFKVDDESLIKTAKEIAKNENAVSLHVRRGDYLEKPEMYCGMCTEDYYKKAIQYIEEYVESPYFYVFSDDLQWVKGNLDIRNAFYIDSTLFDTYNDWYDMYLMACCKHNIIANSSFGWWGAWLNPNKDKIVVAPKTWLNGKGTADIWPDGWKRM